MSRRAPQALNPHIRAQATDWLLRFSEGEVDLSARQDFLDWLRASPEHVRAYLRVVALWQNASYLQGRQQQDVDALIQLARGDAKVFPLALVPKNRQAGDTPLASTPREVTRLSRGRRAAALALAASLFIAIVGFGAWYWQTQRGLYTTGIGEQRTVNLPDGSTVIINARSRVRVAYSKSERNVELLDGEAFFKVAHNTVRPFVVRSDSTRVRAVGTQFDVYRTATGTLVSVVEGKVAVVPSLPPAPTQGEGDRDGPAGVPPASHKQGRVDKPAPRGEVLVGAGEQAIVTAQATVKPSHPNIAAAAAWTEGLLIFDGTPLSEVIQEFNRQNTKTIVLIGPELPVLKISGSFPASGDERIERFLQERFHVVVHEDEREIRISYP
jgi:transmembrane sensor